MKTRRQCWLLLTSIWIEFNWLELNWIELSWIELRWVESEIVSQKYETISTALVCSGALQLVMSQSHEAFYFFLKNGQMDFLTWRWKGLMDSINVWRPRQWSCTGLSGRIHICSSSFSMQHTNTCNLVSVCKPNSRSTTWRKLAPCLHNGVSLNS